MTINEKSEQYSSNRKERTRPMKITDIKAHWIRVPLKKPFHGGTYTISSRATIVTRVYTDADIVGEAFAGDQRDDGGWICNLIQTEYKKLLLEEDPICIDKHWNQLFSASINTGDKRSSLEALSLIDMALWDLIGKTARQPVYRLLGGYRNRIPLITIGGYYQEGKTLDDFAKEVSHYREQELAGIKVKVGRMDIEEDIRRVRIARDAAGDDFVIAADANMAWTPKQAIKFARLAERYNIVWLEEPTHWYNFAKDMHTVKEKVNIPLTAGQSELTRFGCKKLMDADAIDICNVDSSICGGITEWMKIADLANLYGISMAHHEEWQVSMHLFGGIPHGTYAECFADPLRDPLFVDFVLNKKITKGFIEIPELPGLGLELNEEMIRKYQVKS